MADRETSAELQYTKSVDYGELEDSIREKRQKDEQAVVEAEAAAGLYDVSRRQINMRCLSF